MGGNAESGVSDKTALVFGQMNESPACVCGVALSGLTMAEYFRDDGGAQGRAAVYRQYFPFCPGGQRGFHAAGTYALRRWLSAHAGGEMGALQERITSTKNGSVTSVQAVYVPADDLTDPAPATTFSHLDATTVLSRKIAEQGIYPAVDPLESTSRILEPDIVGEGALQHRPGGAVHAAEVSGAAGYHRHSGYGRAQRRGQEDRRPRPPYPAVPVPALLCGGEVQRRTRRVRAPARDAAGFKEILSGAMDEYPEAAFFNAGTIDDVKRKAEELKKGGM